MKSKTVHAPWLSINLLALGLLAVCWGWWPFGGKKDDDDDGNKKKSEADEIIEMALDDEEGNEWNSFLPKSNPGESEDEEEDDSSGDDDNSPDTGGFRFKFW